jgi:death-on-curing protein
LPSGRRHYRITEADAISAHNRASRSGGREGIADRNLILSALGRPYTGYYRLLEDKAAALTQSVAANHGFIDGNKRTAMLLADLLIDKSGRKLVPKRGERLDKAFEDMVVSIVENHLPPDQIAQWFKDRLRPK